MSKNEKEELSSVILSEGTWVEAVHHTQDGDETFIVGELGVDFCGSSGWLDITARLRPLETIAKDGDLTVLRSEMHSYSFSYSSTRVPRSPRGWYLVKIMRGGWMSLKRSYNRDNFGLELSLDRDVMAYVNEGLEKGQKPSRDPPAGFDEKDMLGALLNLRGQLKYVVSALDPENNDLPRALRRRYKTLKPIYDLIKEKTTR